MKICKIMSCEESGISFANLAYHYDPLIMSQKVAPRKHTCVLPRKVADSMLIGNDVYFLGATFYY